MQELNLSDVIDDRYTILEELGRGGFGTVYRARHNLLDKDVALKTLNLEHAEITNSRRPEFFARFKREAKSLTQLRHSSIVSVMDFGMVGDATPFIVMDYFPGRPLLKWGDDTSPSVKQWLTVFRKIFEALEHAHEVGVVHRDIKSANVLVVGPADAPQVMVIDWGIAYSMGGSRITGFGNVVGTTGFVDPENYVDASADYVPESDFYATGTLLFQALCGREPFATTLEMTESQRQAVIKSNSLIAATDYVEDLPVAIEDFLNCLMATERKHRPPSARACVAVIDALLRDEYPVLDELFGPYRAQLASRPKAIRAPAAPEIDIELEKQKLAAMRAEFEQARNRKSSVRRATGEQPVASAPLLERKTEALRAPVAAGIDAGHLPAATPEAPKADRVNIKALGRAAARYAPAGKKAPVGWMRRPGALLVAGGLTLVIVLFAVKGSQRPAAGHAEEPTAAVFKAEDLMRKKDDSALAKFVPSAGGASLSEFPADIKADYAPSIGGGLPAVSLAAMAPPPSAPQRHGVAGQRKEDDIDRTLQPIALPRDAASTQGAAAETLTIPHNTTAQVRLLEELDTSSDEPIRAELTATLFVEGRMALPSGTVLSGHASMRYDRAQARFEKVTLPSGKEFRIAAIAATSDGREGIDGGRLEFGDPEPNKAGEKVLRAVGTVATEALNSIPGGDVLTRSAQTVAGGEIRDGTAPSRDQTRAKNRIIIARRQLVTVKFQAR